MKEYLVSYGEIFLKSEKVRRRMLKTLIENLRKKADIIEIMDDRGKIYVGSREDISEALKYTPGIESFSEVYRIEEFDEIFDFLKIKNKKTFAVRVNRAWKKFPKTSKEIEEEVGRMILERYPKLKVDLENPEIEVFLDIRKIGIFLYFKKIPGMGGLPVGSEGEAVVLFSGGMDSTLSAVLSMKRGLKLSLLFGDMGKFWGKMAVERLKKSYDFLRKMDPEIKIFRFNLSEIHERIRIENRLRCLLCKAIMYKAGEIFCKNSRADAIITGESIGQVASQTFQNLVLLSKVVEKEILRPLLGLSKEEIKAFARRYGFLDITDVDVGKCKLRPKYPETRMKERDLEKIRKILEGIAQEISFEEMDLS